MHLQSKSGAFDDQHAGKNINPVAGLKDALPLPNVKQRLAGKNINPVAGLKDQH